MAVKGKKLLILGGTLLTNSIVETAHRMGVRTVVMDNNPDSPAKRISTESYDVSTANVEDVIRVFRESQCDGIYTSYEDFNTGIAADACERINLPFYATLKQIDLTRNKLSFKTLCREYGINVVKDFSLDAHFGSGDLAKMEYPVIIKPADSYAARGISVCENEMQLRQAYSKAVTFSRARKVVVEPFMIGDYVSITFSIMNGRVNLSAMNDKATNTQQMGVVPLPAAYLFPSKYVGMCYEQLVPGVQRMMSGIEVRNGTFSIEAVVCREQLHVFEMSFRIGGVNDWKFVWMENGINHMEMFIRLALGDGFTGYDLNVLENPNFKHSYGLMNVLVVPGTIARIEGIEEVQGMPEVFGVGQNYVVGDTVSWPGTLRQIFCKVFIRAANKRRLALALERVNSVLVVAGQDGMNMVLRGANWRQLCT